MMMGSVCRGEAEVASGVAVGTAGGAVEDLVVAAVGEVEDLVAAAVAHRVAEVHPAEGAHQDPGNQRMEVHVPQETLIHIL